MKKLVNDFFDRYFHDEESIILMLPSRNSAAPGPFIADFFCPGLRCVYWCIPVDAVVSSSFGLESAAQVDERVTQSD